MLQACRGRGPFQDCARLACMNDQVCRVEYGYHWPLCGHGSNDEAKFDADRCIYCGAPGCTIESVEVQHRPECPSVTNVWPVRKEELHPHGMACAVCPTVFKEDDFYTQIPSESDDSVFIAVCLACGLTRRDEAWLDAKPCNRCNSTDDVQVFSKCKDCGPVALCTECRKAHSREIDSD
jgi:hypothetical protein